MIIIVLKVIFMHDNHNNAFRLFRRLGRNCHRSDRGRFTETILRDVVFIVLKEDINYAVKTMNDI